MNDSKRRPRTSASLALQRLAVRFEHVVLGAMLLVLHLAIWSDVGSALSRSLMLAHLGLFFIWQPIWRRDLRLQFRSGLVFALFTAGFIYWFNWWLVVVWLELLIGMAGGRMLSNRGARYAHLLTLLFLISEILIRCITELFEITTLDPAVVNWFKYGLLSIPAAVALLRTTPTTVRQPGPVDFFRGVTVALMTGIVGLGSLVIMYSSMVDYPVALIQSSIGLGIFLLAISWLLSPHAGFGGLHQVWEQSLLNIGTPFEQWLAELTRLDITQPKPDSFLEASMTALVELPWIEGLQWRLGSNEHELGKPTLFPIRLGAGALEVTIYTRRVFGPMLMIHCKLLVQLLEIFYTAKVREQQLALQAHQQAIYETGARVTHDVKNLLQSFKTLTLALEKDRDPNWNGPERRTGERRGRQLITRQLPLLTQRLELALEKLQAPEANDEKLTPFASWWRDFSTRNSEHGIYFESDLDEDIAIPADTFDSVIGNLLENARQKRAQEYQLQIWVNAARDENGIVVAVTDDGRAIEQDVVEELFRRPVDSEVGLGIGLYQARRQANLAGYDLELSENQTGKVQFRLSANGGAETKEADQP